MPKFNLAEQLASTRYHMDDAEDLGELLKTSDSQAVQRLVILPLAKLVEYKDDNFERTTGRPQPFRTYSQEDLESLAKSIAEHGVIDPITVRPFEGGKYQIIAGRHRTRATALCGLAGIPGIIRDIDDVEVAKIMLIPTWSSATICCTAKKPMPTGCAWNWKAVRENVPIWRKTEKRWICWRKSAGKTRTIDVLLLTSLG